MEKEVRFLAFRKGLMDDFLPSSLFRRKAVKKTEKKDDELLKIRSPTTKLFRFARDYEKFVSIYRSLRKMNNGK